MARIFWLATKAFLAVQFMHKSTFVGPTTSSAGGPGAILRLTIRITHAGIPPSATDLPLVSLHLLDPHIYQHRCHPLQDGKPHGTPRVSLDCLSCNRSFAVCVPFVQVFNPADLFYSRCRHLDHNSLPEWKGKWKRAAEEVVGAEYSHDPVPGRCNRAGFLGGNRRSGYFLNRPGSQRCEQLP